MKPLITPEQADALLAAKGQAMQKTILMPFNKALNAVLAETVFSDRAYPPYSRATMDGIAFKQSDRQMGDTFLPLKHTQAAGQARTSLQAGTCTRIYTGAVLPEGADVVLRQEDVRFETQNGASYAYFSVPTESGQNIHPQGSDLAAGQVVLEAGTVLRAKELAVLATFGYADVLVYKKPKVLVFSLGDELVHPSQKNILSHQIRLSNAYSVGNLLKEWGLEADIHEVGIADNLEAAQTFFMQASINYDLLISTGGVSVGDTDHVLAACKYLNATPLFHGISQRPGKPLLFAATPKVCIFGLPGNPVSAYVCTLRYVLPFLRHCANQASNPPDLISLGSKVYFKPELTYFLPVKVARKVVEPLPTNTSGDLFSLTKAYGVVELPSHLSTFEAGSSWPVWKFSPD
ncbi:MAG: molybdopterin molybdenumtransferase MoeA [Cytophagales bacterium]|nr:MAG: molybdopterin molybdenumtransferase MoeA [Cytophagales bacterium]TAF59231.1 MAG: molybdopterin molybdenumtransferase MoeA [Cytophagales bacterium]